ncbi:MAG: FAD-binding protein, partial [Candidatus Omnitrophota bacterium]
MAEAIIPPEEAGVLKKATNSGNNVVEEIHNACDERWNMCMELMERSDDKRKIALLIKELSKGEAIIELGCGGGAVITILEKEFPEADIFGVDYNGYMVKTAIKNHPKATFFVRDIVHWGDFYLFENKFNSVVIGSTLHEIVSFYGLEYGLEYRLKEAGKVINKAHKMLKEDGILVIRDGIKPDEGRKEIEVSFKTDFASAQFLKFAEDFEPWKIKYNELENGNVKVSSEDFYEYLIKYIYDKPYSWKDEVKEAFGNFTCAEYRKILGELFDIVYETRYILPFLEDKWNDDIEVIKGGFPESHILLAARKKTQPEIKPRVLESVQFVDVLVVGSGLAGLRAAVAAALGDIKAKVAIVSKGRFRDANTEYAQGGVAAAIGKDDTPRKHIEDTLKSGAGRCNKAAVKILVEEGILRVMELIKWGARFDRDGKGNIKFGKEAHPSGIWRVVKMKDESGSEMEWVMLKKLSEMQNVSKYEEIFITGLIIDNGRCIGAKGVDLKTGRKIKFFAKAVILATGGMGQVYFNNSNPTFATADGIGLAARVGAFIERMCFVQFHPTTLVTAGGKETMPNERFPHTPTNFLISEAVRGEGAVLLNKHGERFMFKYHELGELATRDIVARAVWEEMKRTGQDYVWMDVKGVENFKEEFPVIYRRCIELGFDPKKELIPVAPAAHYAMGGIATDVWGRTTIKGLYAAGEVTSTGVHGANRLASNSLLEALVFGARAGIDAVRHKDDIS